MLCRRIQIALVGFLAVVCSATIALGQESSPLTEEAFSRLHQMFSPQPGESRWMEIDWYPTIWEARRRAAAEGKPLFILAGSGGAPAAGC